MALGYIDVKAVISTEEVRNGYANKPARNALMQIGSPSFEILISTIKDRNGIASNKNIRAGIVGILGGMRDARALDVLHDCLNDSESYVRSVAARALGKIGDVRSTKWLAIAYATDEKAYVRHSEAKEALRKIGPAATDQLKLLLSDPDASVRQAAIRALKLSGIDYSDSIGAMLDDPGVDDRRRDVRELSEIKRALVKALDDSNSSVESLIVALGNKDDRVRGAAAKALRHLGYQPSDEIPLRILTQLTGETG